MVYGQPACVVVQQLMRVEQTYVFLCLRREGQLLQSSLWTQQEMDEAIFWRVPKWLLTKKNLRSKTNCEGTTACHCLSQNNDGALGVTSP